MDEGVGKGVRWIMGMIDTYHDIFCFFEKENWVHTTSLTFSGEAAISMCVDRKTIFVLVYSLLLLFCRYCRDCCRCT